MQEKFWDSLWTNAQICTAENGYGLIHAGAIAVKNGKFSWIGKMKELPGNPHDLAINVHDLCDKTITPGFIDCHTHLIYGGNRAKEFELRLQGVTYEEIAKQGGGIQSTVTATRNMSHEELLQQSLLRVKALMQTGVTTIEIKSGYGLDWETEAKILQVAAMLENDLPITVKKTFLGAHSVPKEFKQDSDKYVDLICEAMIPRIAKEKLANAVDVFCEKIAFSLPQTKRIFATAIQYGLAVKCHAEQLSDSGAAKLAASFHALSVDHLEYLSVEGVHALAESGTVAVLLPAAFYFLREKKLPPIDLLRQLHVPMALASDCNPGTSPTTSMLLVLNMACTLFSLTPEEALLGVTIHAAKALGIQQTHGSISIDKTADFAIWDVTHPAELAYYVGYNPLCSLIKEGKFVNLF
ncbi:MAG: imidazolonepropionase [Gammaproteobacteria bacterium RIFCSPHIGHO2_12_FULL_42_10]|nr:MAG: imidazolonepropionase [Gammaproteobacteria bacterium RIFCSPHIGHO2_12_FULL_42_10]